MSHQVSQVKTRYEDIYNVNYYIPLEGMLGMALDKKKAIVSIQT